MTSDLYPYFSCFSHPSLEKLALQAVVKPHFDLLKKIRTDYFDLICKTPILIQNQPISSCFSSQDYHLKRVQVHEFSQNIDLIFSKGVKKGFGFLQLYKKEFKRDLKQFDLKVNAQLNQTLGVIHERVLKLLLHFPPEIENHPGQLSQTAVNMLNNIKTLSQQYFDILDHLGEVKKTETARQNVDRLLKKIYCAKNEELLEVRLDIIKLINSI